MCFGVCGGLAGLRVEGLRYRCIACKTFRFPVGAGWTEGRGGAEWRGEGKGGDERRREESGEDSGGRQEWSAGRNVVDRGGKERI